MKPGPVVAALLATWAVVAGAHDASYRVSGSQLPASRAATGYVQEVTALADGDVEVRIATSMAPLRLQAVYPSHPDSVAAVPEGFELPVGLAAELSSETTAWGAATQVLRWVAGHLAEDSTDLGPQDAASVIRRGRGRCSGLANATAALLMAAGFEARTVSGLLVGDEAAVPHRWVECFLPGAGWVPTDPTLGFWVITSRHMAFASAVTDLPQVTSGEVTADQQSFLPRLDGRPLRPNQGADLVCRQSGTRQGVTAVLRGAGGEIHRARLNPEAHFEGLLPGRWRLSIVADESLLEQTELELTAGRLHSFAVRH